MRALPLVVAAVMVAAVLTGCSRGATSDETVALTKGVPASATSTTASPTDEEDNDDVEEGVGTGGTDDAEQTLPPGDPGADAPGTDDPNGDLGGGDDASEGAVAKTAVPLSALLDTETLNSVAGAGWALTAAAGRAAACAAPVPERSVAVRAAVFLKPAEAGESSSRLIETVSTHANRKAAIAAVEAIGKRLARCADVAPADPRVGDASVQATVTDAKGISTTVTAVAVEGVSFVLSGSGPVTAPDVWAALIDISQGNTCVAAADGCH
jgi:hypothetical protein